MRKLFPGMDPRLFAIAQQVVQDKKGRYFEYYSRLFDRWFQTSVFSTAPKECMMLFSDITEIKRGQKKLEESEEKFRSIIEQSGDGIVLIDGKGTITDYNATMEKISGIMRSEALGRKIWDVQYRMVTHEKRTSKFLLAYRQRFIDAFKTGTADWINTLREVTGVRADGSPFMLQTVVSPIRLGQRTIYVSFNRDVTSLRRTEKELEDQNRLLLEKNIALREVMAQIDVEKKSIAEKVQTNMERLVLPLLARIKRKSPQELAKYLQLLEENLTDITSGFGNAMSRRMTKLTQQEIEICDMIRQGLRCREIASLLNISVRTVETHRTHVRKKLAIDDPGVNLVTYLKNLERPTY
jgi:PAS domain S-box-containing protein